MRKLPDGMKAKKYGFVILVNTKDALRQVKKLSAAIDELHKKSKIKIKL